MHDRVADDHRLNDIGGLNIGILGRLGDQTVDRAAHGRRQIRLAAGIHLDIGDARHQIFAEANLWI